MADAYVVFRPGIQDQTQNLYRMVLRGCSVPGIMHELGMTRGAVLRAWQRGCRIDPTFPRRDRRTDRADFSSAVVAPTGILQAWDGSARLPSTSGLRNALAAATKPLQRLTASLG